MLFSLAFRILLWTICFLTQAQDITFIFMKCHLLRLNLLFQPVKMLLNPDSVIPCISYLPALVVSHRFDNKPSLSSSKSMIKMLRGLSQGKRAQSCWQASRWWMLCAFELHSSNWKSTILYVKMFWIWSLPSSSLLSGPFFLALVAFQPD